MSLELLQAYQQAAQASIDQAHCLPLAAYHDQHVYDEEAQHIFHNDWVFICAEAKLQNPGDYLALDLAGEPIAIIRGQDAQLRALSNICRHRGTPLLDLGYGRIEKNIVCPYHAWTFGDNGQFKGAPMTGEVKIDKAKHCLPQFALECWNGLVFINLSEQPSEAQSRAFKERIKGLDDYLGHFELQRFKHCYQLPTEHWHANWKLAVENGIESYHLFKVHKETLETQTPTKQAYYVAGSSEWTLTGGKMKDNRGKIMKWLSGSYPEVYDHYLLLFLPPSFVGIITYEGFDWIQILPVDGEHCQVIPGGLSEHKITDFGSEEFQFTNAFLTEDKVICERVQRGMHARKSQGGKLVSMEKILVDFHQYLASRLFGTQPDAFEESEQAKLFYSK